MSTTEYPAQSFEKMSRRQAIATCYALEDMRDHALAALARVEALCDSNAGVATRDGALMVSTIRAALEGTS